MAGSTWAGRIMSMSKHEADFQAAAGMLRAAEKALSWTQRLLWPLYLLISLALLMTFLYAPAEAKMGEVQRIFYFHVGAAWNAFLASPALIRVVDVEAAVVGVVGMKGEAEKALFDPVGQHPIGEIDECRIEQLAIRVEHPDNPEALHHE